MQIDFWALLLILGIPSAFTGFCFWAIQRTIVKRDAKRDKLEESKREHELLLIELSCASIALGEATACALRDGKANGSMAKALEYAQTVKHKQKEFINRQGVENLI